MELKLHPLSFSFSNSLLSSNEYPMGFPLVSRISFHFLGCLKRMSHRPPFSLVGLHLELSLLKVYGFCQQTLNFPKTHKMPQTMENSIKIILFCCFSPTSQERLPHPITNSVWKDDCQFRAGYERSFEPPGSSWNKGVYKNLWNLSELENGMKEFPREISS